MIAMFLMFSIACTKRPLWHAASDGPEDSGETVTIRPVLSLALMMLLLASQQAEEPEPCLPCGGAAHAGAGEVASVRDTLQDAFARSMTVPNCAGADHLEQCRAIETLLEEAFEGLRKTVSAGETGGSIDCIRCDPAPHLFPLFDSFDAVADLIVGRGYDEFTGKLRRMRQDLALWRGYTCCGSTGTRRRPARNREMEARAALNEKCGPTFERNRQGLRQVVRMPDDRDGCYQSRACRDATQYNGQFLEAGFWTYDGEYWYIWSDRRTPRGDWTTCNP